MNKQQRDIFNKLPPLQKAVALAKMGDPTITDYDAYVEAKGGTVKSRTSASSAVSKMMTNDDLCLLIKSFQTKHDDKRINEKVMSREQMMEDLTCIANATLFDVCQIIHADDELMNIESGETYTGLESFTVKKLSDIKPEHKKLIREMKQGRYGLELKLIDPMTARKMLADMQGMNAPVKTEVKVTKSLDDFYGDA